MSRHSTVNVGRGRPAAQLRAFALVLALIGRAGIIGWQEIGEGDGPVDEPGALRMAFRRAVWRTAAMRTRTPITWNRLVWRCLGVEVIKVMAGIPGVSPARYVVIVRLARRVSGRRLTRINTHLVAGAFNGKEDRLEQRRRKGWEKHWKALCEIAAQEAGAGVDVVLSFDGNRQQPALPVHELHPRAELVARAHTDYLVAIPAPSCRVAASRVRRTPLGIDFHQALSASIRFPKESR